MRVDALLSVASLLHPTALTCLPRAVAAQRVTACRPVPPACNPVHPPCNPVRPPRNP